MSKIDQIHMKGLMKFYESHNRCLLKYVEDVEDPDQNDT